MTLPPCTRISRSEPGAAVCWRRGEKGTVSFPAPSRATWEQHNPEISGGTRAARPCPARGWDLGLSRAGAGPSPAALGSRQESAAGSDKSRRPRLFALGSRWWRRKRSISSSPAGSSQPRHDLGRGEGAGESCLGESPSKAQGPGDLTAFAFLLHAKPRNVLLQPPERLRDAGAGSRELGHPAEKGWRPAERPAAASEFKNSPG